jgi:hypothetical protein
MKTYVISLDDLDLGQILDGLTFRAESWERTRRYLQADEPDLTVSFVVEECSKPEEAAAIAERYRSIIKKIRDQMNTQ